MQDVNEQWQTVFLITSSLYVFSTSFYLLCGSGQMQSWAMESQVTATPAVVNRPNSLLINMPSPAVYNSSSIKPSPDVYTTDALRPNEPLKPVVNHLTASTPADELDTLNRKSSNKSTTSSKTKDETRRTDHDRDHRSSRQRDSGSTKRKGPSLRLRPEDSLEIYESLSESPV